MVEKLGLLITFSLTVCSFGAEDDIKSYTICGMKCITECHLHSGGHYSCGQWPWSRKAGSNWDYCSPNNQTYYGKWCINECSQQDGTGYFWCKTKTDGSWDYCAPTNGKTVGNYDCYLTIHHVVEYTVIGILASIAVFVFFFCLIKQILYKFRNRGN